MKKQINFMLNGEKRSVELLPSQTLLEMLRETLGIKSPKCGCDRGDCGSCTVMLDGRTVRSCLVLAVEVDGREVKTLEGMMPGGELSRCRKVFWPITLSSAASARRESSCRPANCWRKTPIPAGKRSRRPFPATCAAAPVISRSSMPSSDYAKEEK